VSVGVCVSVGVGVGVGVGMRVGVGVGGGGGGGGCWFECGVGLGAGVGVGLRAGLGMSVNMGVMLVLVWMYSIVCMCVSCVDVRSEHICMQDKAVDCVSMCYMVYVRVGQNRYICTVYDRIFDDLPANCTVCTPYIHGSGQPCVCVPTSS